MLPARRAYQSTASSAPGHRGAGFQAARLPYYTRIGPGPGFFPRWPARSWRSRRDLVREARAATATASIETRPAGRVPIIASASRRYSRAAFATTCPGLRFDDADLLRCRGRHVRTLAVDQTPSSPCLAPRLLTSWSGWAAPPRRRASVLGGAESLSLCSAASPPRSSPSLLSRLRGLRPGHAGGILPGIGPVASQPSCS
jgi:hypothetical protein